MFAECAARYLDESKDKASVNTIAIHIVSVIPFIGHFEVEKIHDGTLASYIASRKVDGVTPTTINRALEVVRTILIRAAKVYRDEDGLPWLKQAPPAITMLEETPRPAHPLSWKEQDTLFELLPKHLKSMVLFAVSTGLRDENVCGLRWDWEVEVPEIGRSVFVIPWQFHKSGRRSKKPLVVILNDQAWSLIEEQRGFDKTYVFVYRQERKKNLDLAPLMQYRRIGTMNNSAWHRARDKANLSGVRVHDLRHTFATRLRASGVSNEDRASLLGHATKSMPEHYAAADIGLLIKLSNCSLNRNNNCTVLSVVRG